MSGGGVHNPSDPTQIIEDIAEVLDAVEDLDADVVLLQEDVTLIREVTDALPTLTETRGTVTTDGNEQNVYVNLVPLGVFKPVCVKIDFTNHTGTETVVLRTYYRITAGLADPFTLQDTTTYTGVVSPELINIDLEPNRYGVRVTIEKTVGTNRAYNWEAFYEL